ncbi:hypothetical protein NG796_05350 [Laspinema sp. A4]|uniref:hypothetical protein n=1 Tax=Laspinema sp. D2d TaxID=2953686 RepID=UPI0021BA6940|nr:hypothetical protein [Laspinema sp. D2d]MCT7982716.1 hypothetical protein [Laspinema sp. D2d]
MGRYDNLNKIQAMDPIKDHAEIVKIMVSYEFPWDFQRSQIEMAFARFFAGPRIAGLVAKRGYAKTHPQKRYDDTSILLYEMIKHGYDSEQGRACIERMNYIHSHFPIHNDDFLYVTTVLIVEPVEWNARFGWRLMCGNEIQAWVQFWWEISQRMHMKNLPNTLEGIKAFKTDYENKYVYNSPWTKDLVQVFVDLISSWFPLVPKSLINVAFRCLLDDKSLQAFEMQAPPIPVKKLVEFSLRSRGILLSFLPPRTTSGLFVDHPSRSYPNKDYNIAKLGPSDENLKQKIGL